MTLQSSSVPAPFGDILPLSSTSPEVSEFPLTSPPGTPPSELAIAPRFHTPSKRFVYLPRRNLPLSVRVLLRLLDTLQSLVLNILGFTLVTLAAPLSLLIAMTPCHRRWDGAMLEVLQRSWDILDVVEEAENIRIGDWIHRRWHTRQLAKKAELVASKSGEPLDEALAVSPEHDAPPALHKNDSGIDLQSLGSPQTEPYQR